MQFEVELKVTGLRDAVMLTVYGLAIAAVLKELSKPEAERQWHGQVLGVPYDFRRPTLERIREAYWNPDDPRIFTNRVLGIGWAVNLPILARNLTVMGRRLWEQVQASRG